MSSKDELTLAFLDAVPNAAARALQELPPAEAAAFLDTVPARLAAPVLNEMIPWHAARQLELISAPRSAMILRQLAFPNAATLTRLMRPEVRVSVFEALPAKHARRLDSALRYPQHQVGAWIDPQVPTLSANDTIDDALRVLRAAENTSHVFLETGDHGEYAGTVAVREILRAEYTTRLNQLKIARTAPVSNRASLSSIAFDERWDECLHLPVVGRRDNLLGGLSRGIIRHNLHAQPAAPPRHTLLRHLAGAFLLTSSAVVSMVLERSSPRAAEPHGATDEH